jgi:hypothetical protein
VPARILGRMTTTHVVAALAESTMSTTEALLREAGAVEPPTVHMLAEDLDQPYVGYVECRPFYRGADAEAAIADLALVPSVLAPTRLVVTWKDADLGAALGVPGVHPNAVVVLEASLDGDHTMVRYPFDLDSGPAVAPAVAQPRWGVAERLSYTAARLPGVYGPPARRVAADERRRSAGDGGAGRGGRVPTALGRPVVGSRDSWDAYPSLAYAIGTIAAAAFAAVSVALADACPAARTACWITCLHVVSISSRARRARAAGRDGA